MRNAWTMNYFFQDFAWQTYARRNIRRIHIARMAIRYVYENGAETKSRHAHSRLLNRRPKEKMPNTLFSTLQMNMDGNDAHLVKTL